MNKIKILIGDYMEKCNCYHTEYNKEVCYGTKEIEEYSCDGDEIKCNFYIEKRVAAQAEKVINESKAKKLRTKELQEAYEFLCDFDSFSEYQKNLTIVLDTLDFVLVQNDSLKEGLNVLTKQYIKAIK